MRITSIIFERFLGAIEKKLSKRFFFDYGNLEPSIDTFSFSRMRIAVGGGLRVNFPLPGQPVPLAFYLGYPIRKQPEDEERLFLFSMGTPF